MTEEITPEERRTAARRMRQQDQMTVPEIARRLGVSTSTVRKYCLGIPVPRTPTSLHAKNNSDRLPVHNEARQATKAYAAFQMRLAGHPPSQIAVAMGVSRDVVRKWLETEIAELVNPLVERWRVIENERLDRQLRAAEEVLERGRGTELALKALDRMGAIGRRRAALNGLDMPIRVDVHSTEKTQADLELDELLREAQARNQIVEAEIVGEVVDDDGSAQVA